MARSQPTNKRLPKGQRGSEPLIMDGRTGEGVGQVVRVAVCLAALTGTHIKIENVRGNRPGSNRGGLRSQHVAGIRCLAGLTNAELSGCQVGCKTLEFHAGKPPFDFPNRNIQLKSDTAGNILLVLQTILPFLVFASDESNSPISLTIQGGTNLRFSPSFEYLDQVLLPSLEKFGIFVERTLERRGWSLGPRQIGSVKFKISPLPRGECLRAPDWPTEQGTVSYIDISLVVPASMHNALRKAMSFELDLVFPGVDIEFKIVDDSRHESRMYALLVAHTTTGLRFGKDWLYDERSKGKDMDNLVTRIAQKVVDGLDVEIRRRGVVDEHLQDQLVIFQALAAGKTSFPGSSEALVSDNEQVDQTGRPFGSGSLHTTTARWVVSQILPGVEWVDKGRICTGVGLKWPSSKELDAMVASMDISSEPKPSKIQSWLPPDDDDEDI